MLFTLHGVVFAIFVKDSGAALRPGRQIAGISPKSMRLQPIMHLGGREIRVTSTTWDGGRDRDRTCDPLDVNEVLSR
jgi:hypothetical protein